MSCPSITCPVCARTSHHPIDVRVGWCGACERFTRGDTHAQILAIADEVEREGNENVADSIRYRLAQSQRPPADLYMERMIERFLDQGL